MDIILMFYIFYPRKILFSVLKARGRPVIVLPFVLAETAFNLLPALA